MDLSLNKNELKRLERKLRDIPDKVLKKHARAASNQAMAPVVKEMKRTVPIDEGILKKSLTKKQKSYPRQGIIWTGAGSKKNMAPHFYLVELGHRIVTGGTVARKSGYLTKAKSYKRTGTGVVRGFVAPRPFMRDAFKSKKDVMLDRYTRRIKSGILEDVRKG